MSKCKPSGIWMAPGQHRLPFSFTSQEKRVILPSDSPTCTESPRGEGPQGQGLSIGFVPSRALPPTKRQEGASLCPACPGLRLPDLMLQLLTTACGEKVLRTWFHFCPPCPPRGRRILAKRLTEKRAQALQAGENFTG